MQKEYEYNDIFQKLVHDEEDMIGFLAFSLFEERKLVWIDKQTKEGKSPNKKEIKNFVDAHTTDKELNELREHALFFFDSYAESNIELEKPHIEEECYKRINEQLKSSLLPFENSIKAEVSSLTKDFQEGLDSLSDALQTDLDPISNDIENSNTNLSCINQELQSLSKKIPKKESLGVKYIHGIAQSILGAITLAILIYVIAPLVQKYPISIVFTEQTEQTEQKTNNDVPSDSLPPKEISLQPQKSVSSQPEN